LAFRTLFSFYGGKGSLSNLYPPPKHPTIIEPFAGGASYSLRYCDRQVLLIDTDPIVAEIWKFLLSPGALQQCRFWIPDTVKAGMKVTDIMPDDAPAGVIRLMQSEANFGTQGAIGIHNQITRIAAGNWPRLRRRLEHWLPRISHWRFGEADYTNAPDVEATWFIDPPYNNAAGSRYRHHDLDYHKLAEWAKGRRGQVIVCENAGADWLPFTPLAPRRGVVSSYQKSRAMEVIYHR